MSASALAVTGLSKAFGGLRAVDEVSFDVAPGERRVLIGPNGAGKTTLFHCISGAHRATSGSVACFGYDITHLAEHQRTLRGIGRTFQISSVFIDLPALENVALAVLGIRRQKWAMFRSAQTIDGVRDRALSQLEEVGLAGRQDTLVKNLSYGERRQQELALALVNQPRVLLLDEPCAGLSPAERRRLFGLIEALPRSITMLMIEHDMDVALGLADRVTVLHRGRIMQEGSADEIRVSPQVRDVYFGQV